MTPESQKAVEVYAHSQPHREVCGFLLERNGAEVVLPVLNVAKDATAHFEIRPQEYLEYELTGELRAIWHSHVNGRGPEPSQPDRASCENTRKPWWIYSVSARRWDLLLPSGHKIPLLGREFCYGVLDCFTLIRDYFRYSKEDDPIAPGLEIEIPWVYHEEEFWHKSQDMYGGYYERCGFAKVPPITLRTHDVICMAWDSKVAHHGAIYVGGNLILHHLYRRLSKRDVYGDWYRRHTAFVLRHRSLLRPEDKIVCF